MIKDATTTCPHGWVGPWSRRPCGCRYMQLPYSEVCMHMKVAGSTMWVGPVSIGGNAVQLYDDAGVKFSAPILDSEAGYTMTNNNEEQQA